jgi:hypothetical protein
MVSNGLESPREIIALGAMLDTILDGGTCKGGVTSCKAALESEDSILQIFPTLEERNAIERFGPNWNGSLTMSWDDETLDTTQSAEANSFYQEAPPLKHEKSDIIFETLHITRAYTEDNDVQKMVERDRTNFTSDLSGSSESSSANDRSVLLLAQEQEDKIDKRVMPVSQKRETLHDSEINSRESIQDQQDDTTAESPRKTVSSSLRKFSELMKSQRGSTKSLSATSSMVGAHLEDEKEDGAEAKRVIKPEETNIDDTNVEDTAEPPRKTVSSFLRKFSKLMKSQRGSTRLVPESSSMVGAHLEDEKEDDAEAKGVIKPEETNIDDTNVEERTVEEFQANDNDNDNDTDVTPTEVGSRSVEERDNYYVQMEDTKLDQATVRSIPSSVAEIEHGSEKEVIEMATGEVYVQIPEQGFEIQKFEGHRLEL